MNPVFIVLVIVIAVLLWFLLAFLYKPLGKLLHRIWKDSMDEINKEDEEVKKNE